jgi:hypothetical protein
MPRREIHYCPGCESRIAVAVDLNQPRGVFMAGCPSCGRELILQLPGRLMEVRTSPPGRGNGGSEDRGSGGAGRLTWW